MSVIASHWITTHDGWSDCTSRRTCVRKDEQLAKNNGASHR